MLALPTSRRLLASVLSALAIGSTGWWGAAPAHAYETFDDYNLTYGVTNQKYWIDSSASAHVPGIDLGMMRWNGTSTPISYAKTSTKSASRMDFYKSPNVNSWWGKVYRYVDQTRLPDNPGQNWWWAKVFLDGDFVNCPNKIGAIEHEAGHVMGLAHNNAYSVMNDYYIYYVGTNVPTADDAAGINHLY